MFEKNTVPNQIEEYQIDANDVDMVTAKYLSDPISALHNIRDEVLADHSDLTTVAIVAIDELESIRDAAKETVVNVADSDMQAYLECDDTDIVNQNQHLITLLKRAGYSKAEVVTWAKITDDTLSATEMLQSRSALALINKIYGTD